MKEILHKGEENGGKEGTIKQMVNLNFHQFLG